MKLFNNRYISDKVETTVSADKCALDRIIIAGDAFKKAVIEKTNQTYYYNLEFGLSLNEVYKLPDLSYLNTFFVER